MYGNNDPINQSDPTGEQTQTGERTCPYCISIPWPVPIPDFGDLGEAIAEDILAVDRFVEDVWDGFWGDVGRGAEVIGSWFAHGQSKPYAGAPAVPGAFPTSWNQTWPQQPQACTIDSPSIPTTSGRTSTQTEVRPRPQVQTEGTPQPAPQSRATPKAEPAPTIKPGDPYVPPVGTATAERNRGRIQIQGNDIRGMPGSSRDTISWFWARSGPVPASEGLQELDILWNRLSRTQQRRRNIGYNNARNVITRASSAGGLWAPYSQSYPNPPGQRGPDNTARIDIVVISGVAFDIP
jgi:hypothetical protein